MPKQNYYDILQVSPTAEPEVIQAAFKRLAFKYHPDRNSDPTSQEMMRLLNEAYKVLSDSRLRASYDAKLRNKRSSQISGNQENQAERAQQSQHTDTAQESIWPNPGFTPNLTKYESPSKGWPFLVSLCSAIGLFVVMGLIVLAATARKREGPKIAQHGADRSPFQPGAEAPPELPQAKIDPPQPTPPAPGPVKSNRKLKEEEEPEPGVIRRIQPDIRDYLASKKKVNEKGAQGPANESARGKNQKNVDGQIAPPRPKEIGVLPKEKPVDDRVAQLIKDLKSKKAADRIKAAEGLRDIGEDAKDATGALCDAMLDGRAAVVTAVAAALEKVDPGLQKAVLTLVVDQDASRQRQALETIARLREEGRPAMSVVLAYADHNSQQVTTGFVASLWSSEVIRTLMAIAPEDKRVFTVLRSCLLDGDNLRRNLGYPSQFEAAVALSRTPFKKESVKVLITLLREATDKRMRAVAAYALGEIGPEAKDAVKFLEIAKIDPDAQVRDAAAAALKKIEEN